MLSLHNLPLCRQGKINTKYAVISSKQLQITVHRTTHYSQFHLLAEFSKNLYRMPFFAVCAEDELKWKFKPDTLVFCLLRIFLQLSWKTQETLVGTRSLSAKVSLCRMFSFELSEQS